jgi:hypothetical protein
MNLRPLLAIAAMASLPAVAAPSSHAAPIAFDARTSFAERTNMSVQGRDFGAMVSADAAHNAFLNPHSHAFVGTEIRGFAQQQPSPSPVPEPASVALMLAGLGAVGALARRRARR